MPKGQKIIDWTPENESKLLHTIMAVHDVKVDYDKVAAAFGPSVPASCIGTKWKALRKKAAASGIVPSPVATANSRTTVAGKGKKSETIKEEDDLEQAITPPETSDETTAMTTTTLTTPKTKVISGRIKKPRASPRKTEKKNYKKIEDPFVEMEDAKDENGKNVFGQEEESGSEDTVLTDGEFETTAEHEGIKVEEEA